MIREKIIYVIIIIDMMIILHTTTECIVHYYKFLKLALVNVRRSLAYNNCRRRSLTSRWMNDCEEFGLKHAPNYPVLYYHLSLINALAKLPEQSRKNFRSYILKYVYLSVYVCVCVCLSVCAHVCVVYR